MATLQTLLRQLNTLLDFLEEADRSGDEELFNHLEKRVEDFVGQHPALAFHLHAQAKKPHNPTTHHLTHSPD